MKIGVTGTRTGMNETQKQAVTTFLQRHTGELHHGDCVGVDAEVAAIAKELGYRVVCHPPVKDDLRAFFVSDENRNPLSYFARNRQIVDEVEVLLVVPFQDKWQSNGGTWYTHDYAIKKHKDVVVLYPNGEK
jgi:hypothetical protein